jgi:hypothetical protein
LRGFDVALLCEKGQRGKQESGRSTIVAAIAFDTLKFARRLKDVGVPEQQAEAQAELMAEAFVFNMDSLVTRDYLEAVLDARFAQQDAKMEARFGEINNKINLHSWILAIIAASTVIPAVAGLFGY